MNNDLYKAILAMDSYNRGYGSSIKLGARDDNGDSVVYDLTSVGLAVVFDDAGDSVRKNEGFYGIAYKILDQNDHVLEHVIAYRGTDYLGGLSSIIGVHEYFGGSDANNGYGIGAGLPYFSSQGVLAIGFYQDIAAEIYGSNVDLHSNALNISFTGHSMGGGLAGYVADLYAQKSIVFDNMAFEASADVVYQVAAGGGNSHLDYKQLVYGNSAVWENSISGIKGYYTDGEFLGVNRLAQDTPMTALDIGPNVNLTGGYDGVNAHSMATLSILLYAKSATEIGSNWRYAAKYFWPVMYDDDFALLIGADLPGGSHDADDYSGILRQVIAYSAIDEGTTIFGDTGIRALYDDANDFGKALSVNGAASSALDIYGEAISKIFVQYAGELALEKVEKKNVPDSVLKGVLSYEDQGGARLMVDLSEERWAVVGGGAVSPSLHILGSVFDHEGVDADSLLPLR